MQSVTYTGSIDSPCPITHVPFRDLTHPVAFLNTPSFAYECDDLIEWLLHGHAVNPMTNTRVTWINSPLEIMGPCGGESPDWVAEKLHFNLQGWSLMQWLGKDSFQPIHYLWAHVCFFLLTANNVIPYGDFILIPVALIHWYFNAGNHIGECLFLSFVFTVFIGEKTN